MAPHPSNPGVSRESLRLLYSPFVTLKVGPEKREFCVHRDLLCHHSKYFQKAFKNGNFEESRTGISTIENVDFRLIKIFVGWLYNGKLTYAMDNASGDMAAEFKDDHLSDHNCSRNGNGSVHPNTNKNADGQHHDGEAKDQDYHPDWDRAITWYWLTLIRLYIFADYFDAPSLCTLVTDALSEKFLGYGGLPGRLEINHAYNNTAEGSKLRKFLVDLFAYHSKARTAVWWVDMPKQFLADIMVVNISRLPSLLCEECFETGQIYVTEKFTKDARYYDLAPFKYDLCAYHEHKTEKERQQCRKRRGSSPAEDDDDTGDEDENKEDQDEDDSRSDDREE